MAACMICGMPLTNDEVALSVKLCGLACAQLRCYECAAAQMNATAHELREMAAWFRESGCEHFQRDYITGQEATCASSSH